jgi:hypothetical protein
MMYHLKLAFPASRATFEKSLFETKLNIHEQTVENIRTIVSRNSWKWRIPGACIIKLITAVIYGFRNKLECLSLKTRLGWKSLPGTNTLAYYGNRKLWL